MGKRKKQLKKIGLPPGTPFYTGEERTDKVEVSVIDFNEDVFKEVQIENLKDCKSFIGKSSVTWINVNGIHEISTIEKIGEMFQIHPLTLEDITNINQRPKMEDFKNYLYVVLKMLSYHEEEKRILSEQVSFILIKNCLISFQERKGDVFDPIRERIRNKKGRIRKMGADYLMFSLFDVIVDNYFLILEKSGESVESLDEKLITNPQPDMLNMIHLLKREMIHLRKAVFPLRELILNLERSESPLIQNSTDIYFRDLYDHTIQVMDTIETFRDFLSGMKDTYMTSVSNKMNEVMKVLTIIATIFIPLTFIAGLYGMNFKNMPELEWKIGYPLAIGVMVIVSLFMLLFFKKRKWF